MTFYEKEAAEQQKRELYFDQKGICPTCGTLVEWKESEAAHRIPKHGWIVKKYGKEVIHHKLNLAITHRGACNAAVMIMPESVPALELIKKIREEIENV